MVISFAMAGSDDDDIYYQYCIARSGYMTSAKPCSIQMSTALKIVQKRC